MEMKSCFHFLWPAPISPFYAKKDYFSAVLLKFYLFIVSCFIVFNLYVFVQSINIKIPIDVVCVMIFYFIL